MLIKSGEAEIKTVDSYEFSFSNGFFMQIFIDEPLGDKITFYGDHISIDLVAKPDPLNPNETLAAEHTTILKQHLLIWQVRQVQQITPSAEQRIEMENFIKSSVKSTVN